MWESPWSIVATTADEWRSNYFRFDVDGMKLPLYMVTSSSFSMDGWSTNDDIDDVDIFDGKTQPQTIQEWKKKNLLRENGDSSEARKQVRAGRKEGRERGEEAAASVAAIETDIHRRHPKKGDPQGTEKGGGLSDQSRAWKTSKICFEFLYNRNLRNMYPLKKVKKY